MRQLGLWGRVGCCQHTVWMSPEFRGASEEGRLCKSLLTKPCAQPGYAFNTLGTEVVKDTLRALQMIF